MMSRLLGLAGVGGALMVAAVPAAIAAPSGAGLVANAGPPILAQVSTVDLAIDYVIVLDEADGAGKAEPYLWSVAVVFDGTSIVQDPQDDYRLVGSPRIQFGAGSHRNITGGDGVGDGDVIQVPPSVGQFSFPVRPIELDLFGREVSVAPMVATIAVLMEEDNTTDDGAEAAHRAFNQLVTATLDDFVESLSIREAFVAALQEGPAPLDMLIDRSAAHLRAQLLDVQEQLMAEATSTVKDAMIGEQNLIENAWTWFDPDDFVGVVVHYASADELARQWGYMRPTFGVIDPGRHGKWVIGGSLAVS